jgi:hypothetical protein
VLSTTFTYQLVAKDLTKSLARKATEPVVARETEYYRVNIGRVKSIDDFLKNTRLYSYAMKAFGLGDMAYAKAFMRKALEGGIDSADSFANKLTDTRYKDFVAAFNFARYGEFATGFQSAKNDTVDKYVRMSLEEDIGKQDEGARLALYFARKASSVTDAYGILADKALLEVFQTAFSIPSAAAASDIDGQARLIAAKLDIKDLKDPKKVEKLLTRFTALWELRKPQTGLSAASLIVAQPRELGVGAGVLASLQRLKLGGI